MFKRFLKYLAIATILLSTLLFSIPFIVSVDEYRPILEEQLSLALGRQVIISELSPQAMPLPALTVTEVSILGTAEQPEKIFIEQMRAVLDPLELLNGKLVISSIQLDGVDIHQSFINSLINRRRDKDTVPPQATPLTIRQISGSNIMLHTHDKTRLGPYRFTLQLGGQFKFEGIVISRMDETLHITIRPDQFDGLGLRITGNSWQLPVGPPLQFDKLSAQATLYAGRAELTQVKIDGYGGTLTTHGTLSWHDGWQYSGKLATSAIQLASVLSPFDINTIDGHFHSEFEIQLHGNNLAQLFYNPELQGTFQISDGVVSASNSAHELFKFDQLNAQASLHFGRAELNHVEIDSYNGTLTTRGTLSWYHNWQYHGKLTTAALQLAPALSPFDIDTIDGLFYSELDIRLHGKNPTQLFYNPELKGAFRISDGVISKSGSTHELLKFDELSCNGHLKDSRLITDSTVLKTAGGAIYGTTHLSWKKHWNISGTLEASGIDTETFLTGFVENKVLSGTLLYAATKFHFTENDKETLLDNPYLSGDFRMINGVIHKADLAKATTTFSKSGSQGGETPFQDLTGRATLENNHITIANLGITSDSLSANGDININPDDELEGEIVVALRKTASIISVPLKVSGTINDPNLRLTNDAIIGSAIGISILGPGIGTAVGMQVGRIIKKIGSTLGSGNKTDADIIPR